MQFNAFQMREMRQSEHQYDGTSTKCNRPGKEESHGKDVERPGEVRRMVCFKVMNTKLGESFTVHDSCIFDARYKVEEGIRKRKWKEEDCTVV